MESWQNVLFVEPVKVILTQIGHFLINVLLVIIILIAGWLISNGIKGLVVRVLKTVKFDELSKQIELDNLLKKGGITYSLSELMGMICYWLALLITFVVAVNAIGLTTAIDLLNRITLYIPNIIAAIFILILGMFVATLLKNIVKTAATNAGLSQASFLAKLAESVVIVFALLITLEQLGIGAKIIELTISILLGALGLAFALSFGLGCKDIAAKFVENVIDKIKSNK